MSYSTIFSLANMLAMIMWLLMLIVPNWKPTRFLVDHKIIPIALSALYGFYIIQTMTQGIEMNFGSLEGVMGLFSHESATLAGWLHYLAFDLIVGMWMITQNRTIGIHPLLMIPCLLGAFMLGPIGFLVFILFKKLTK